MYSVLVWRYPQSGRPQEQPNQTRNDHANPKRRMAGNHSSDHLRRLSCKAKAQRCRVASRTESESVMFIVVGSRSDPSAIACEQRRPDVIVLFGCWTGRAHVHTADVAPGRSPRALCDVTDDCACDCGARVGADRSRRLTVYRITLAVSLLLQLNCAPVRAGSCPLLAHTLAQAGRRGASGPVAWMQSSNEHNECLITAIM